MNCNESKLQFWPKTQKAEGNRKQTQCPRTAAESRRGGITDKIPQRPPGRQQLIEEEGRLPQRTPAGVTCQQTGGWRCVFGSSLQCFVLVLVFGCGLHGVFAVRAYVCQHIKIRQFHAAPNESIHMD